MTARLIQAGPMFACKADEQAALDEGRRALAPGGRENPTGKFDGFIVETVERDEGPIFNVYPAVKA